MAHQSKNLKESVVWTVIASTPALIFGAVGSWLIGELSKPAPTTETKVLLASFLVVCFLLIILSIFIITYARRADIRYQEIKELFGTPVELVFDNFSNSKGLYFRRLTQLVQQASDGDEILIMTYHDPSDGTEHPGETKAHKQARDVYNRTLLQKAKQNGISYHRIVCFGEGPEKGKIQSGRVKQRVIDHCSKMLEIRNTKPDEVSVKKARTIMIADMIIIGEKVAAYTTDIHDHGADRIYTAGTLIFHNPPNGQIIERLRAWFKETDGDSIAVKQVPEE